MSRREPVPPRDVPVALRALLLAALIATPLLAQTRAPFLARYVARARAALAAGETAEGLTAVQRALERDPRSLEGLRLLAALSTLASDQDTAAHALHRWLTVVETSRKPPATAKEREEVMQQLLAIDVRARAWTQLKAGYVKALAGLAHDYRQRKDLLAALEIHGLILEARPDDPATLDAIKEIRRTGGREVAVEDVYAGGDPNGGLSAEQIEAENDKHRDWDQAWTKETENYRYRTDAGFLVLQTSAIAMEQMNRFYRRFFRFKEDGGATPRIEIRIFKSRDEYLALGSSPVEWSGGQFTGDAVETFVGGVTGRESVRSMYRTLFHEAGHQFVSLTGPGVPGWLNEAYASFFEGCEIMSNGTVRWNRVPTERLFALAARLEKGFMAGPDDGVRDGKGEWAEPEKAPTLAMVVEGNYAWGPPWYAPTWGVVYFLYNWRDAAGRAAFRDPLHAYYQSFKKGPPTDPIAHFTDVLIKGNKLAPAKDVAGLNEVWKAWILQLRDREIGKDTAVAELLHFAQQARKRKENEQALQFLEEALEDRRSDPDLLWETAQLLEAMKQPARAAAFYRELERTLEQAGQARDERCAVAARKVLDLDPLARSAHKSKADFAEKGIALAREYEQGGLPTMALEIARGLSAQFSVADALAFYGDVAERTGKSLARWRVAYDEESLAGWSGGDGSYAATGDELVARVPDDAPDGKVRTRELVYDTPFVGDFSLEAEVKLARDDQGEPLGSMAGMCFGRKDDKNFHAVLLHTKGFMDVTTFLAGDHWSVRDHRQVPARDDWRRLRIDVTGRSLDVYLDGFYLRSLEFPSIASVRGTFGLVAGPGEARFRQVRVLPREAHDPAGRIERELAMKRVMTDPSQRAPGTFSGIAPPAIAVREWIQGEPTDLEKLRGHPVLLAFATPAQDAVIPTAAYFAHLAGTLTPRGLKIVIVCDGGTTADAARARLAAHPIPGAFVGIDKGNATYGAFFVKTGFFGLPRFLLVDRRGVVQFEGDPGLKKGVGWQPDSGATYVDDALERLLSSG